MSPTDQLVSQRGTECLLALARSLHTAPPLSKIVIGALLRLGARRTILESIGVALPADSPVETVDEEKRYELISRLMAIVKCFAE